MKPVMVRELRPFSLAWLADELGCTVERAKTLVGDMMARGIVRYRTGRKTDPEEADVEGATPCEVYQFRFVGLVMIEGAVIVAYPKYFHDRTPVNDELGLIMRVVKRDAGIAVLTSLEDGGEAASDKLPVMLALLELYGEYGEYSNYVEGRELNGNGSIDWNRTIGGHLPVLSNGRPIYMEYETRKTYRDGSDFITRLHRAVLTECSREFGEAGIDKLLSLDEVCLSDEDIEAFGDVETLGWRLERERAVQFSDWKLLTLDLLERYLLARENEVRSDEVQTLGTTSFYHLWEEACKTALGDALGRRLGELELTLEGKWAADRQKKLIEIIPRPLWERWRGDGFVEPEGTDTLIPDAIAVANGPDGERLFCICDAKYYVPSVSGKMEHQPGLESVAKQFLYQSAYRGFIEGCGFDRVVNAFLVPGTVDVPELMARVSFPGVFAEEEMPLGNYINMLILPAGIVFEAYLRGEVLNTCQLLAVEGVC